jgi:para-nitrobenzyl esterase
VGNLRFAAPQPPPSPPTVATSGTTTSSKHMRNNRRSLSAPMLRRADVVAASDQELLLKAVYAGSPCPQPGQGKNDAEDCLFLSIIRPEGEPTTPLPVLIFVHGGGFQAGSGSQYIAGMRGFLNAGIQAGAPPAMVAVINYRLGAFGFMGGSMMESLANRTQPDAVLNAGTRDIKAATEWVRDNIADFGGECSASA